MSTVINTNILANNSHRSLKGIGTKQSKASARLSSGFRINSAADDAAGLAISEKMKAQIRGMKQAERNVQDGISLIQTAEGGMSGISEMVIRQRELIIQALNDTNSDEDRAMIQLEIDQLTEEIDAMAGKTKFNTIPLLNVPGYVEVNDNTTITNISGILVKLGRSPVNADGTFDFIASNADGTIITDFLCSSTSKTILNVSDGASSKQGIDIRDTSSPHITCTYSGENPIGTGWVTNWEYDDGTFNFHVSQHVGIVTSPNADGEMYDIWYEVYNNSGTNIYVDMLMSLDIDITSPTSHTLNPDFLVDGSKTAIDKNTIFSGTSKPQTLDIYSTNHLNLNLQSVIPSGMGANPDELWIGNYSHTNSFGFQEGQSISDSAYALVYNNRTIADSSQYIFSMGKIGVTDPRNNPELNNVISSQIPTNLFIQSGANEGEGIYIDRYDCRASSLGIKPILIDPRVAAEASLGKLDTSLNTLNGYRANCGAQQNRLEYTAKSLAISHMNLEDANSRIADADMAKEMMELAKSNILQQAGMSMLAQANQHSETVMQLLRE